MDISQLSERLESLEKVVKQIQDRNTKVELEKAWETSFTRRSAILVITYLVAATVMYLIGVDRFMLNAIIPVLGFWLSTFSVSTLKKCWLDKTDKVD